MDQVLDLLEEQVLDLLEEQVLEERVLNLSPKIDPRRSFEEHIYYMLSHLIMRVYFTTMQYACMQRSTTIYE